MTVEPIKDDLLEALIQHKLEQLSVDLLYKPDNAAHIEGMIAGLELAQDLIIEADSADWSVKTELEWGDAGYVEYNMTPLERLQAAYFDASEDELLLPFTRLWLAEYARKL